MSTEYFIRGSDNQIKLALTEDNLPISGEWIAVDIHIVSKVIHRDINEDGVSLDIPTGILMITPGELTSEEQADIAELASNRNYRTYIVITTTLNPNGAVFGGPGSNPLFFHISDKPLLVSPL